MLISSPLDIEWTIQLGGNMALRPVFMPNCSKPGSFKEFNVKFDWTSGFSIKQKQKSILSLHESVQNKFEGIKVLEISTKSVAEVGVKASAFNLMIPDKNGLSEYSVEAAFQSAKKFEYGGPYDDIRKMSSRKAKTDQRLKNSGRLISFEFFGQKWDLVPMTAFYDWLYINALYLNSEIYKEILNYNAFTDIEFNPKKSINCQARSAAIFVSLYKSQAIKKALSSKKDFLMIYEEKLEEGRASTVQGELRDIQDCYCP